MNFITRFFKNGIASTIQKLIRAFEQLLLVPFFISSWGAAYYGEWITLTIIPTVIGLSEFGFGTAAGNSLVLRYAANDKQGASNMAFTGFRVISVTVLSAIAISVIVLLVLVQLDVFDRSLFPVKESVTAVSFLMAARLLGFYHQLCEAHFKAARKASQAMHLISAKSILVVVVSIAVLVFGGGIVSLAVSVFFANLIFTSVFFALAKRVLPIQRECGPVVKAADVRLIVRKGLGFMLTPAWQALFFQGSTMIVRIVLGPVSVAIFNTARTAIRALTQVNGIVIAAFRPELQFEIGAGHMQQARRIFRFSWSLILISSLAGVALLYFFGPQLYRVWTNKALDLPNSVWNIFLIGALFNSIRWASSEVLLIANKPFRFGLGALFISLVSLGVSYVLCQLYGLNGAAIGVVFMEIALFVFVFPMSCRMLDQPLMNFLPDSYRDLRSGFSRITVKRGSPV